MKSILNRLFNHQYLSRSESKDILIRMERGEYNDSQIAAFITVYLMRSISIDEFFGFSDALLDMCSDVSFLAQYNPIDIVGTGGDNKNTFNISTLSCFVVAACGYKVAKHGNYGSSSVSGASTVMEQFGVKFTNDVGKLEHSLEQTGMAYLHAPLFNNALKVVTPVRKQLAVRTFFNMLGPVVNPIRPKRCLLGVFNLKMARMYHYMYQQTDVDYSIIHGLDGYDEISLTGDFKVINRLGEQIFSPSDIGLPVCSESNLFGGETPVEAAKLFQSVICNKATTAQKNAVLSNAAFAIRTIEPTFSVEYCLDLCREAMDSGRLEKLFYEFIDINS